jgi:AsmA protein
MRKTLKVFAVILSALILLLLVGVGVLLLLIDPNQFKPQLAEKIQEKIGREVEFAGDLHLSVFPALGLSSERIRVKNVPGFQETDFLTIQEGEVKVNVLPLLGKKLEISRIDLKGLRLNLIRTRDGLNNWSIPGERGKENTPASSANAQPAQEEKKLQFSEIGGASVKDAEISWDDRRAGKHFTIDNINLDAGSFTWDRFTDLALELSVAEPESGYRDHIDLNTRAMIKQNLDSVNLADVELKLIREKDKLPEKSLSAILTAPEIIFEKAPQKLQVAKLQLQSGGLSIASRLTAVNLFKKADVEANIAIAPFNPGEWLKRLEITLPAFQDATALSHLQASFNLHAAHDTFSISALRCKVDNTALQGDIVIAGPEQRSIRFNLAGDIVDIGRYLPPDTKNKNKLVSPAAAIGVAFSKLPVEWLRKLDAEGVVNLQHLKMNGIAADGLSLKLNAKEGVVQTRQEITRYYHGGYSGSVDFNAKESDTLMALTEKVEHADIEAILKLMGSKISMNGVLTGSAILQGQGKDAKQIKQDLKGNLAFSLKEGAIKDVKFQKILDQGISLLNHDPVPPEYGNGIDFSEISGTGTLANGVIRSQDLLVKSSRFRITGSGMTNINTGLVDYRFVTHLVKTQATAAEPEKLHSTPIVVNMTGTLADPSYRLDTAALLTEKNKAKVEKFLDKNQEKIDKLKDKLDKKLGPGVGDLLKHLF